MNYGPGEIIVKLKADSEASAIEAQGKASPKASARLSRFMGKASSQRGFTLRGDYKRMNMLHYAIKPGQRVEDAINELSADPDVEYAEPNYIFTKATVGSFAQTFSASDIESMAGGGYLATGAPIQVTDTWGQVTYNSAPVVAVIDTGLDVNHPAFSDSGAIWVNPGEIPNNGIDDDNNGYIDDVYGWNFITNSNFMHDDDGHGTHVAGIILGVSQDIYTPPYAPAQIKIMPLKFLDGSGYGKTSDAIKAIYYAVKNGATVLNNSWGGPSYSAALHEAIAFSYSKGVSFVAAAGNEGRNNDASPMYPANYKVPNVISVAATTDNDNLAYFSNYGKSSVSLASPGVWIISSVPPALNNGNPFGSSSGTSMAAPFVAGVAALIKAEKPTMLSYQMKQIIANNGNYVAGLTNKTSSNMRLNANAVLNVAKIANVDSSQPAYSFSNEDRELASAIAAGGCGLVQKMMQKPGGGAPPQGPSSWVALFVLALLVIPMLIYTSLRRREDMRNRRQHERFKIDSQVRVNVGGRELVGSVSSISLGGVQLNTEALLEQGGIVAMTIRSPDGQDQIKVEGRVVWSEAQKAYGVQFAQTAEPVRQTIMNWTKGLTKV